MILEEVKEDGVEGSIEKPMDVDLNCALMSFNFSVRGAIQSLYTYNVQ